MKRRITFACRLALAAVAVALTLGACQKEENISGNTGELMTLRVEVENQGADGSKMETDWLQVYWSQGDVVGIKYHTYPVTISGGNAGVQNVPVSSVAYSGNNRYQLARGVMEVFNAYYPPSIANYDDEYDQNVSASEEGNYLWHTMSNTGISPKLNISLQSRYESGFADGRQQIRLPMIGTYFYRQDAYRVFPTNDPLITHENVYFPIGREVLRFQHLTGALLVRVRNDSGQPLLLDRVAVSSNYYKLSGTTRAIFNVTDSYLGLESSDRENLYQYSTAYRAVQVEPVAADNDAQKQVEVVFPEPVVVAPGDFLPVQVPILPIGYDNLTVRVEGRNESAPGTVGSRSLAFEHTVEIPNGIARNTMKTIQIKMDPASERVTVSAPSFSVDGYNKVLFSKGNLQYDTSTFTWSFMEHQWSTVETHGQNVGENYATQPIVSLFGWGTSGHDYGPDNYHPRSTSTSGTYGPGSSVLSCTGQSDWGCNAITNGGNSENSGWFTLSKAQWQYLLSDGDYDNPTRRGKWSLATVNNVPGLVLLPDDWDLNQRPLTPDRTQYTTNTYSGDTWEKMETLGAVFLPAAGMRNGTSVTRTPQTFPSTYWTNDHVSDGYSAYALFMVPNAVYLIYTATRHHGSAVRLVRYAQ